MKKTARNHYRLDSLLLGFLCQLRLPEILDRHCI